MTLPSSLRLAWRMARRDFAAGELTLPTLALILAVAALTSVGLVADRCERALILQAHQLLGGDVLLVADHPWPEEFRTAAMERQLALTESMSFFSMVANAQGAAQMVEVKAVANGYPLRGGLFTAPRLGAAAQAAAGIPLAGTVWPDERLAGALQLDNRATLRVGRASYKVSALLTQDPELGIGFMGFAPRLLMNLADLPATGLIQPGSRISYRLHLAGSDAAVAAYQTWANARLQRGERIENLTNARPEVRAMIERAQRFLKLAALLTVILAALAAWLSSRRYLVRHVDSCAVLRCCGARGSQLLMLHGGEFFLLGLAASGLGVVIGWLAHWALIHLLGRFFTQPLPAASGLPWLQGFAVGVLLTLGFILPQLTRLKDAPTLRVLRRDLPPAHSTDWIAYILGAVLICALIFWVAADARLGAITLAGFAALAALYALCFAGLLHVLRQIRSGGGWRLALASLRRRPALTLIQGVALALGLTALLLLTVGRADLLQSWQAKLPPDAPNRFVINLQPDQRLAFADLIEQAGLPRPTLLPMVRGRLTAINGKPVLPADYAEERAQRLVEREFNLSWSATLPVANRIVAGNWFDPTAREAFSVEEGLAKTLGLKLNDRLTFTIEAEPVTAPITSLRKLDWDSMRVNFFVIAPPALLQDYSASYITSFYEPADKAHLTNQITRQFPNLTVVDVSALLRQLQDNLAAISRAVQGVFAFALLAGLVVLVAALHSGMDERAADLALLRTLGARNRQLKTSLISELTVLGALAGVLAGLGAAAISTALGRFAFQLDYLPSVGLPALGGVCGIIAALMAAWPSLRRLLLLPPLVILRET